MKNKICKMSYLLFSKIYVYIIKDRLLFIIVMSLRFRSIPYLLSQYAWVAFLALFAWISFLIPYRNKTGDIISNTNYKSFNHSQIPGIFTHLSDVHIDHLQPEKSYFFDQAISLIINTIKPDFNVITGDLANNYPNIDGITYSRQQPDDIRIYEKLSQRLRDKYLVIENDGNHDALAIYSYETKRKQSKIYENLTLDDYHMSIHSVDINGRNYTFITLNQFNFPTAHAPLFYYAHSSTSFYDKLESLIDQIPEENEIIVTNHFPYFVWRFGAKSSSGKTFQQILKNKKIGFFLNGHLHPAKPLFMHYHGLLEIVGCDLTDHKKFSVAIIDNGRLSYHPIDLIQTRENSSFAFITNPLPDELLSNHQIFNEKNTWIRVIVYSNKEPSIYSSVYPNVLDNEKLSCRRIDDESGSLRFWLCETELNVNEYGKYRMNLTGDVEQTLSFTIDESLPSYKEDIYAPLNTIVVRYEVYLALIWFFLLIITFPFVHVPKHVTSNFEMWIEYDTSESMWIYSIFFGFLAVKSRIDRLPNLIRYSLFIVVLWPFCMPLVFMTIEKHFGFVWTWGFVCNGAHYAVWGQYFALMYLTGFVLPITLLFSALAISLPLRWTFLIDLCPMLYCLYYDYDELFNKDLIRASNIIGTVFSMYSFTLVYFFILMIVWRGFWRKGLKEVSLIPSTALLDNQSRE